MFLKSFGICYPKRLAAKQINFTQKFSIYLPNNLSILLLFLKAFVLNSLNSCSQHEIACVNRPATYMIRKNRLFHLSNVTFCNRAVMKNCRFFFIIGWCNFLINVSWHPTIFHFFVSLSKRKSMLQFNSALLTQYEDMLILFFKALIIFHKVFR